MNKIVPVILAVSLSFSCVPKETITAFKISENPQLCRLRGKENGGTKGTKPS